MEEFLNWLDNQNQNLEKWLGLQEEIRKAEDEILYEYAKYSLNRQLDILNQSMWN